MKLAVIVQMRLDSSRLPRKALLPLGSTTLAETVLQRLASIPSNWHILACDAASQAALAPLARKAGFEVFVGPKDDVLARFCRVIEYYQPDYIVRATGDNPFVSTALAGLLVDHGIAEKLDYAGFIGMPSGMGVELVRAAALLKAGLDAVDTYEREHVCPHLYRNMDRFRVGQPACPAFYSLADCRITIDTPEDYERACRIVSELGEHPSDRSLLAWLRTETGRQA